MRDKAGRDAHQTTDYMGNIVVFGCSGHAKVVLDALEKEGRHKIVGLLGEAPAGASRWFGYPVLGRDDKLPELIKQHGPLSGVIAIGDNQLRRRTSERIASLCPEFSFASVIHSSAEIGRSVEIGDGAFVAAGATICADAKIGRHAIINTNASVDHDSDLESFCFIGPNAALGGDVRIGTEAFVGIGASIIQGATIGARAVIGAGAAVISDIPDGALAVGVPAKIKRR